jgi:hypothetical protein
VLREVPFGPHGLQKVAFIQPVERADELAYLGYCAKLG